MPTQEPNEARAAEAAIGRRPLTGREKQALFASWRGVHGGAFDCEGNLRSLEREAAQNREKQRADATRLAAEREAEALRERKRNAAVKAAALVVAEALRERLPDVLARRWPKVFGPEASHFSGREALPQIIGPRDEPPDASTRGYPNSIVVRAERYTTFTGATHDDQRPAVVVTVEVRAVDQQMCEALLMSRLAGSGLGATKRDSPILEALSGAPLGGLRGVRSGHLGHAEDLRDRRSTCDTGGSYTVRTVAGYVGMMGKFVFELPADPGADAPKPAAAPEPVRASWRGEGKDWVHSG